MQHVMGVCAARDLGQQERAWQVWSQHTSNVVMMLNACDWATESSCQQRLANSIECLTQYTVARQSSCRSHDRATLLWNQKVSRIALSSWHQHSKGGISTLSLWQKMATKESNDESHEISLNAFTAMSDSVINDFLQ